MSLRTYQAGSPRKPDEGLRIGTVRFPPRGVRKEEYARLDFFDVWFPVVAPSRELLAWVKKHDMATNDASKRTFQQRYRRELESDPAARQSVLLLAALAQQTSISIGCFCEDENNCHRSVLKTAIEEAAKALPAR
ncbi:MAG TPA: DUF488 family protein [Thermoanaerobaculia bacterium]|jgi:uncharacterized protein YeaO (DUF488 family)|nr:DUF488 family protein [Thermoanaerobaculia bacterium]